MPATARYPAHFSQKKNNGKAQMFEKRLSPLCYVPSPTEVKIVMLEQTKNKDCS